MIFGLSEHEETVRFVAVLVAFFGTIGLGIICNAAIRYFNRDAELERTRIARRELELKIQENKDEEVFQARSKTIKGSASDTPARLQVGSQDPGQSE